MLRTRDQVRWGHVLAAEQDNLHTALRWAIGRGDADTALRFVRSLGYFWVQPRARRGRRAGPGNPRPAAATLASLRIAEARVICTLIGPAGPGTSSGPRDAYRGARGPAAPQRGTP